MKKIKGNFKSCSMLPDNFEVLLVYKKNCYFSCLAKNGSGVIQMEPLEVSWLIRACVVLHNLCLDWGLQAVKPKDCYDPEIELEIQQEAAKRFLRALQQNRDRSVLEVRHRKRDMADYLAGLRRRNLIYHQYFGGPEPGRALAGPMAGELAGELAGALAGELARGSSQGSWQGPWTLNAKD